MLDLDLFCIHAYGQSFRQCTQRVLSVRGSHKQYRAYDITNLVKMVALPAVFSFDDFQTSSLNKPDDKSTEKLL